MSWLSQIKVAQLNQAKLVLKKLNLHPKDLAANPKAPQANLANLKFG
jgi:hypothetical protein